MEMHFRAFDRPGSIKNDSERPFRRNVWIELFKRTRRCVSRIRKQWQSGGFALFVQFLETCLVQVGFAANFENLWRSAEQFVRHRFDGLNILCDVVPHETVATSR